MGASAKPHFIIVGAGVTGLCLAQALKKENVPFSVYERDPDVDHRGRGWGLTLHWALDDFLACLPDDLAARLSEIYVNPTAVTNGENGNFLFYDLQSGEARWQVPAARRMRVARERLRKLLLTGLDVQWGKPFASAEETNENGIIVKFEDGTTATGTHLIGCDGARSNVRKWLYPSRATSTTLPLRLLGADVVYSSQFAKRVRDLDPYFFQGGDPKTDSFLYFSFLDTPENNQRADGDTYTCQIITSWPHRKGYLGSQDPIEVPSRPEERVALMKRLSSSWNEPFRSIIQEMPDDTPTKSIPLEEWIPSSEWWNNRGGKVTLIGDAAHAMTMFRGEAANHGIRDITSLLSAYRTHMTGDSPPDSLAMMKQYEEEMIPRTSRGVRTSTKACEDAHNYAALDSNSPLVSKRSVD